MILSNLGSQVMPKSGQPPTPNKLMSTAKIIGESRKIRHSMYPYLEEQRFRKCFKSPWCLKQIEFKYRAKASNCPG